MCVIAVTQGAGLGDVYVSTKCVFHSRRIPAADAASGVQSLEEYGFGHYRSPPLAQLASAVGAKLGVVSTSDSLDCSPDDLNLMRSEGAAVKEMEAAAIAWVCQQASVPFFALKAITDIVDGPHATQTEFYQNLSTASRSLQQKLSAMVACFEQHPLSHWISHSKL
jgi:5'-methylthioadenosine nucleosidase